jgi:hypothetical protein
MAFDTQEIQQLKGLFNDQEIKLRSVIREEINEVKERLDRLVAMGSGDIRVAYDKMKVLKKRVLALEHKLTLLK